MKYICGIKIVVNNAPKEMLCGWIFKKCTGKAFNKVALIGGKWVKRLPNFVEGAVQLFHALGQKLSTNFVDSLKVCDRNHRELQNIAIFRLATVAPEQNPPKILFSSIQIFFRGAGGSPYP